MLDIFVSGASLSVFLGFIGQVSLHISLSLHQIWDQCAFEEAFIFVKCQVVLLIVCHGLYHNCYNLQQEGNLQC